MQWTPDLRNLFIGRIDAVIEVGSQLVFKSPQKAAEYFGIYRRSVSKSIRFNEPVCNGLRFSYYEG